MSLFEHELDEVITQTIPKQTIEMMYIRTINQNFICLCGIERKSKSSIRIHIKNVHFGQTKKVKKSKAKNKVKVPINCYNCNKTFVDKNGVTSHIKRQTCANDQDTIMKI